MVEILAVGVAVDHDAAEFELMHAALELVGGRARILHREMAETRIAFRTFLDLARQEFIGVARLAARDRSVGLGLHAGSGQRQDRSRDAGAVHGGEPHVAEVRQPCDHLAQDLGIDVPDRGLPVGFEPGTQEVLFERYLLDHSLSP